MFGIAPARLRYWERTALVCPSAAGNGEQAVFQFGDLAQVKSVVALLERGVPLRRIRSSLERARQIAPEVERPLGAVRGSPGGGRGVVFQHEGNLFESDGQMVFDFERALARAPDGDRNGVVTLAEARAERIVGGRDVAIDWFEQGCELDTDAHTQADAIAAYRHALEADPTYADAHCNLGTVYFNQNRRREARQCFEQALQFEPHHLEANFNLASLLEESGSPEAALRHYRTVLTVDPTYSEAHVNIALLYGRLGLRGRSRRHWRRYLSLEPDGPWTDLAQRHLRD